MLYAGVAVIIESPSSPTLYKIYNEESYFLDRPLVYDQRYIYNIPSWLVI